MLSTKHIAALLHLAICAQAIEFQLLARRASKQLWTSSFYAPGKGQFAAIPYGQTVNPHTFPKNTITSAYPESYHNGAPGDWSKGYYPLYIYPSWAYGPGSWSGAVFEQKAISKGLKSYTSQLRNITFLAPNTSNGKPAGSKVVYNRPLLSGQKIFTSAGGLQGSSATGAIEGFNAPGNEGSIDYTDFNNGTVQIIPCGVLTSSQLGISAKDCSPIILDIRNGKVISGRAEVNNFNLEATTFTLYRGNVSARVRTQTISRTSESTRKGVIAGIVVGAIAFVAIVGGVVFCFIKRKRSAAAFA
ncbi:hypothetical protein GQ54DRAFT_296743 [Martensiomyces pterosporus]|nr:hypothetical protein GQ54DRAFT_296743 [Martensiomyces pterosporus]